VPIIYRLNADSTVASKLDLRVIAKADIIALDAPVAEQRAGSTGRVLVDCVEGCASVSFMAPFSHDEALAFSGKSRARSSAGDTVLLGARLDAGSSARSSSDWIRRPTSRTAPISRKCWCIAPRAAMALPLH